MGLGGVVTVMASSLTKPDSCKSRVGLEVPRASDHLSVLVCPLGTDSLCVPMCIKEEAGGAW